jgi:hypothetical protein
LLIAGNFRGELRGVKFFDPIFDGQFFSKIKVKNKK